MSEITSKAIEQLLDLKLVEKFDQKLEPINTKLPQLEETLSGHTTALANLATDVKKVLDEKTVTAQRLDQIEEWVRQASQKLGIEFRP